MGANTFFTEASGKNSKEAFLQAVEDAYYDYGHAGYTGSIAEKDSHILVSCPDGIDAYDYADLLIDKGDARVSDKWGPAGCILISKGEDQNRYLFFGWASS